MPRTFRSSTESSLTVQRIHEAFCEHDFWLARLREADSAAEMESFDAPSGSVRIVVAGDVGSAVLPGPMKRLYPGGLKVVQTQRWALAGDELHGETQTQARGTRGSGLGRLVLTKEPDAERIACTGTFDFKVPIVGGTLETLFGRQMVDQMPDLLRFIAEWHEQRA